MKKSLGKIVQPTVFGSKGGATTLLLVVLITVLWLSITGRIQGVRAAFAGTPPPDDTAPVTIPGGPGNVPPGGDIHLPNLPTLPPIHGPINNGATGH